MYMCVRPEYNTELHMDCDLEVSEFELQSRNYVHFRTNTLRKSMDPLITSAMG